MSGPVLLDAQHIQKYAYDDEGRPIRGTDVLLLADASLELLAGEVHALVGENGAGKTTLIKVIGGALPYEGGSLHVDGRLRGETSISRVRSEGIAVIWQEFSLAPHLSVVENMFLGRELRRGRRLDKGEMRRQAADAIATLGVSIDLDSTVERLSTSQQQLVEIARALNERSRILILDEPTASLSRFETERLFELLGRLRAEGLGILFVTHRLDEVFTISDRVSVLKDGRSMGTLRTRTDDEGRDRRAHGRPSPGLGVPAPSDGARRGRPGDPPAAACRRGRARLHHASAGARSWVSPGSWAPAARSWLGPSWVPTRWSPARCSSTAWT